MCGPFFGLVSFFFKLRFYFCCSYSLFHSASSCRLHICQALQSKQLFALLMQSAALVAVFLLQLQLLMRSKHMLSPCHAHSCHIRGNQLAFATWALLCCTASEAATETQRKTLARLSSTHLDCATCHFFMRSQFTPIGRERQKERKEERETQKSSCRSKEIS